MTIDRRELLTGLGTSAARAWAAPSGAIARPTTASAMLRPGMSRTSFLRALAELKAIVARTLCPRLRSALPAPRLLSFLAEY